MKAVVALQDYDCHWYVIPKDMEEEFYRLQEKVNSDDYPHRYDDEEEFEETFSKYKTGGDLNLVQLYADIE